MAARRTAVPQLDALFRPGRIGPLELPNRIIVPAMDMGYDEGGYVSDRHVAFCEARAKGGVAMQIVGGCAVSPEGIFGDHFLRIDDDRFLPGLRRLTEAVHRHGSLVAAQLFHAGRDAFGAGSEAIAPSPVPSRLTKRTPRAMTEEDIHRVVADFAAAARRAREAGFDAVEILGSSGFLIAQFLSPLTNRRTDAYGGSAENRLRFALEVVRAVRAAVGSDYPVLFRHTVDDLMPGGNDLEANLAFAPAIEAAGVDAFTVQVGWEESSVPTVWMTVPRGAWVWMAEALKGVVGKPVVASHRINDPVLADRIVREGRADFVFMARALLADPDLARKAREGRLLEIRPCIACNQLCLDPVFVGEPVGCLVNPEAGRELEWRREPAPVRKRVLVAGGGAAGMEAARVLAERGHDVVLYEREPVLGGQLNLAAAAPHKGEFAAYVRHQVHELHRLGVRVVLGRAATPEVVREEAPDAVIVATGGRPRRPDIPGVDLPHVVQAHDVLAGRTAVGRRVVIIGAHGTGCDTALYVARSDVHTLETLAFLLSRQVLQPDRALRLAIGDRRVHLVRRTGKIADDIGRTARWVLIQDLQAAGVEMMTGIETYRAITPEGVLAVVEGEERLLEADTVVLATGLTPERELYEALAGTGLEVHVVGDAHRVRDAAAAIYEGAAVARAIGGPATAGGMVG